MSKTRILLRNIIEREMDVESYRDEVKKTVDPKFIVEDMQGNELGRTVLFEDAVEIYMKRYPYVKKKEVSHQFITKIEN